MWPMTIDPQPLTVSVSPAILALNNAHSIELSWLDAERLAYLVEQSFYARKIGTVRSCSPSIIRRNTTAPTISGSASGFRGSSTSIG